MTEDLNARDLAGFLGVPAGRLTYRAYKARLRAAETGKWPSHILPSPDSGVDLRSYRWAAGRVDVAEWVAANARPTGVDVTGWWTVPDIATRTGVRDGQVTKRLHADRRTEEDTGVRPAGGVPEPDLDRDPQSGRKRLFWNPSRPDVQALAPPSASPSPLDDPVWLRAQYALPPDGLGRSVLAIAAGLGVARPTVLRRLRVIPGIVVRGRVDAVGAPHRAALGMSTAQAALHERRAAARARQVAAARRVLVSGVRLSARERLVLEGRVQFPDLATRELAEVLGVPTGSLAALGRVLRRTGE